MSRNAPGIEAQPISHRLWLQGRTQPIRAAADQTLLVSAQQAGIELLASCRNGTCRACLRRLISGQVHYRIEWPGLSAEEKSQGCILPCVAYPASDLVLAGEA
jgi:ferredoxin